MPTLCGIFGVTPLIIMNGLFPKLFALHRAPKPKNDLRKAQCIIGISAAKVQRKIRSHNSGNG